MKKIILFESSLKRRQAIEQLLNLTNDLECVGSYSSYNNALNNFKTTKPDLVLVDVNLTQRDSIEAIKIIRKHNKTVPIIVQSFSDNDELLISSIQAGADGYILNSSTSIIDLLNAIYVGLNGGSPLTPIIAKKILNFLQNGFYASNDIDSHNLTEREKLILSLIARGFSYKMISNECFISTSTVASHIQNIYGKLGVKNATAAVAKAVVSKIV